MHLGFCFRCDLKNPSPVVHCPKPAQIFFGVAFTIELVLKLFGSPCGFFKDRIVQARLKGSDLTWFQDPWNLLDGIVLGIWYLERVTSTAFPLDPMILRLFRLSRLMRMVRQRAQPAVQRGL